MNFWNKIKNKFKTKLPQGREEFEAWSNDILNTYDLPNNRSTKFALATSILHAPPTAVFEKKEHYGKLMMKGAANEVAAAVMQELKKQQQEEIEKQKAAEVTAITVESSNAETKTT